MLAGVVKRVFAGVRGRRSWGPGDLTRRQREILALFCRGLSCARIAEARVVRPVAIRNAICAIDTASWKWTPNRKWWSGRCATDCWMINAPLWSPEPERPTAESSSPGSYWCQRFLLLSPSDWLTRCKYNAPALSDRGLPIPYSTGKLVALITAVRLPTGEAVTIPLL